MSEQVYVHIPGRIPHAVPAEAAERMRRDFPGAVVAPADVPANGAGAPKAPQKRRGRKPRAAKEALR